MTAIPALERPALRERILSARERVVLLRAPAGFGKTALLAQVAEAVRAQGDVTVIDDADSQFADPAALRALRNDVERGGAGRWIVSGRALHLLPIDAWIARGIAAEPLALEDWPFCAAEVAELANRAGCDVDDRLAADIVAATQGWPLAVVWALRRAQSVRDRTALIAETRRAVVRLVGDEVYADLPQEQRELLAFSAALPTIDVEMGRAAGLHDAELRAEGLTRRCAFVTRRSDGTYECHELLRRCLQWQIESGAWSHAAGSYERAGAELERAGKSEPALGAYLAAGAAAPLLRLLENAGFELIDRGRTQVVARAIQTLSQQTCKENACILALSGMLAATEGRPQRAQSLLRRALDRSKDSPDFEATVKLKLALVSINRGENVEPLLTPLANEAMWPAAVRAEALSLLAAQWSQTGKPDDAREALSRLEPFLADVQDDVLRAKLLQRIGATAVGLGDAERGRAALSEAADLATELQMYSLASRAYSGLHNISFHYDDDVWAQRRFALNAATAAEKAGNAFDLQNALVQAVTADFRLGNNDKMALLESKIPSTDERRQYLAHLKVMPLAWEGRFDESHRALGSSWTTLHYDFDRGLGGAQCALYLALDNKNKQSIAVSGNVARILAQCENRSLLAVRYTGVARSLLAMAEAINGRFTHANRLLRQGPKLDDDVVTSAAAIARRYVDLLQGRAAVADAELETALERLSSRGYHHVRKLLHAVWSRRRDGNGQAYSALSRAERQVLELLAEGLNTKDIAERRDSSIQTVRVQVNKICRKLSSRGRLEALATARRLGIIS